jgi:hypothetical protein
MKGTQVMADTYIECLIRVKKTTWAKFIKMLLIMIAVAFAMITLVLPFAMVIAVVVGIIAYMFNLYTNIEYEYLYLDRELIVDKIMAQTKRKRIGVYAVDRVEIMAPIKSYHLDNYKNRTVKTLDLSDKEIGPPDRRYVIYYEGNLRLILTPTETIVKAMKNLSPRKIFLD